jgi:hypothetical protein
VSINAKSVLLFGLCMVGALAGAQDKPTRIYLSPKSNITTAQVSEGFAKNCPNVVETQNEEKADYILEAAETERFSDKPWLLAAGGWFPTGKQKSEAMPEVGFANLSRSTCRMDFLDNLFGCDISNETDMAISSVMIEISWKDGGKAPCKVELKTSTDVSPHTMSTLAEHPPCARDMETNSAYSWRFVGVQGHKPN